jgi:DNA-binding NarL/FixJ family response regulator
MEAIGRQQPDLVLLDLKMPTIDGPSMLEFIRKEGLDVSVIIVSGFVTDQVAADLSKLGVSAFVGKPFRAAEILKEVEKAIASSSPAPTSMDALYESTDTRPKGQRGPRPQPMTKCSRH